MKELLKVHGVKKYFKVKGNNLLKAVDDVSFSVNEAQIFGLVGESGCGKSTLARLILRLMEPTGGEIFFDSIDVINAQGKALSGIRKSLQIVFQDPLAALNPRRRVIDAVGEALLINKIARRKELKDRVVYLLQRVGLDADALYKYPHEFSGGQRQRICIARALAVSPEIIVADEPLSALDVSIEGLFQEPFHPYTEALLSAMPEPEIDKKSRRIILEGDVPSPVYVPAGCPFHPRCHKRFEPCDTIVPAYREAEKDRWVSCHLWSC
ncbi:MAG: ABC transporter ATP-binding protein [Nitrospirae bacterium]|nr:ABC transporter ATP-binding protein [Nitrospirota bacterium]